MAEFARLAPALDGRNEEQAAQLVWPRRGYERNEPAVGRELRRSRVRDAATDDPVVGAVDVGYGDGGSVLIRDKAITGSSEWRLDVARQPTQRNPEGKNDQQHQQDQ